MADKHPYISGTGGITNAISQLKKSFPTKVTADTLKKLGIAPNNESYVINILRFIGALDEEGSRTAAAATTFSKHDKSEFEESFSKMLKDAYADLFSLHGDAAWSLDSNRLISFFRTSDKTSDLVGRRQASTFQVLASFAGHGELPQSKPSNGTGRSAGKKSGKSPTKKTTEVPQPPAAKAAQPLPASEPPRGKSVVVATPGGREFGLTVRIEVNLPATADQDTYDRIFRSIRENLLNDK